MLIWVGAQAPAEFVRDVFGVASAAQLDTAVSELPPLDTPASLAVRALVDDARARRRKAMRVSQLATRLHTGGRLGLKLVGRSR